MSDPASWPLRLALTRLARPLPIPERRQARQTTESMAPSQAARAGPSTNASWALDAPEAFEYRQSGQRQCSTDPRNRQGSMIEGIAFSVAGCKFGTDPDNALPYLALLHDREAPSNPASTFRVRSCQVPALLKTLSTPGEG